MEKHKISEAEAAERLELQEAVNDTVAKLAAEYPDDYAGVWIEHEPVYRIIIGFKDADQRAAVRETIPPKQRRYVQLKNVRQSVQEREASIDRVIAALQGSAIRYMSHYEHRTDDLVIVVSTDDNIGKVRQLLPADLRSFVKIERGSLPRELQATGGTTSDYVYPGFWWNDNKLDAARWQCSFSFAARDSQNREGILTAGHCPLTDAQLYRANPSPHWVTLTRNSINQFTYGTKYDYRFYRTSGITTGAWLWFENGSNKIIGIDNDGSSLSSYSGANVMSGYPASGYWKVTGTYGYYDQKVGDVLCKTGRASGLTCGKITHGYLTFRDAKGWIRLGDSYQRYISIGGDSGGAVFTSPINGNIKAAGILSAGNDYDPTPRYPRSGDEKVCSDVMENNPDYDDDVNPGVPQIDDCYIIHMPIDYIDDHQLLTVITQPAG